MSKTIILGPFTDRSYYAAHFMDAAIWEPYARQVCRWHGYECSTVRAGVAGTFPTFICELDDRQHSHPRSIVVKFFGPLFEGRRSFQVESILSSWVQQQPLSIPSPAVLASGQLDDQWDYLVFEFVDGRNVGEVRGALSREAWRSIAIQMGEYIRQLHQLSAQASPELPGILHPSWDAYLEFLAHQRQTCYSRHQAWKDLPEPLLDQLDQYVLPAQELVDTSAPVHLIHADLTADHLLGTFERGSWHTRAIIDWGDAKTGTILQELLPLHLDLFRGDRQLLKACLEAYHLPAFYREDFPRKALSMLLLDLYPLPDYLRVQWEVTSLDELAERLFGLPTG